MIAISATQTAVDAAQAYAARTGTCVQAALDALPADLRTYCNCEGCLEDGAAQAAAETWAEGAWLRAAEAGQPCQGIMAGDGGCLCC